MITITPKAAEKIKESLNSSEFRFGVQGGGCSGLQYVYLYTKDAPQQESDTVFESNGIKIIIDGISLKYLDGSEITWIENAVGGQPFVNNPHAKGTCGCGQSFEPSI